MRCIRKFPVSLFNAVRHRTVKVRLQSQLGAAPKYSSTLDCFKTIIKQEKIGVAAVNALLFGVYGIALDAQRKNLQEKPTLSQIFWAGTASGFHHKLSNGTGEVSAFPVQLRPQVGFGKKHRKVCEGPGVLASYAPSGHKCRFPYGGLRIRLQNQTSATDRLYKGPLDFWHNGLLQRDVDNIATRNKLWTIFFFLYLNRAEPAVLDELLCRGLAPPGTDPALLEGTRLVVAGGVAGIFGWMSTYPTERATRFRAVPPDGRHGLPAGDRPEGRDPRVVPGLGGHGGARIPMQCGHVPRLHRRNALNQRESPERRRLNL
ncbi:MAG: hypothetical protein BJ554DRAFT_7930 [Olpidium bornovanus]|uniref:Uncharacterized protein n=1 Tax=Olpidium bornovanus TaxID=278681 RepID=A0A8H7ZVS7_9FUNG|nr:MAG: hypothetical protein BJ554DRAFT_7930 [Olpidium bornovanus]